MLVAKQVADLITVARAVLSVWLAWLGVGRQESALPLAVWILIVNWTGDSIDGPLARRSRIRYRTWIGDHDLQIDMFFSIGLMAFIVGAGFVDLRVAGVYAIVGLLAYLAAGFPRVLGMLFQAPIYGWFIVVAVRDAPGSGWWLVIWIIVALVVTWPRFAEEHVPGFLDGMRELIGRNERHQG